jgi:cytochrome b561
MTTKNRQDKYAVPVIVLHWLTLLLLIAVYSFIELRELFPKDSDPRNLLKSLHFMFGLTVLAVVCLRLFFRLSSQTPAIEPPPSPLVHRLGQVMHVVLYIFLLAMPVAGWMMLSAAGKPIPFFGLELPALIGENEALAKSIKSVHTTAGSIGYLLIAAHALAGLYHHYVKRDNTLKRMLLR